MTQDPSAVQRQLLEAVHAQSASRIARAKEGDHDAIDDLITGGFQLLDQGFTFVSSEIVETLDALFRQEHLYAEEAAWYLNLRGRVLYDANQFEEALVLFERALEQGKDVRNRELRGSTLLNMGNAARALGSIDVADEFYRRSLTARGRSDAFGRLQAVLSRSNLALDRGDISSARRTLTRLLSNPTARSFTSLHAAILGTLGRALVDAGDLKAADQMFRRSAEVARRARVWPALLPALQNVGVVNLDLGNPGIALRWSRRAERLARLMEDYETLSSVQRVIALALLRTGRAKEAISTLQKARSEAETHSSALSSARLTADIGAFALTQNSPESAIEPLRSAVATFIELGQASDADQASRSLARAFAEANDPQAAVQALDQLASFTGLNAADHAELLESLGDVLATSKRSSAEAIFKEASRVYPKDDDDTLGFLLRVGLKLQDVGNGAASDDVLSEALALSPRQDSFRYRALNDRALARAQLGRLAEASIDLESALSQAESANDRAMEVLIRSNLSEIYRRAGDLTKALGEALQSIELSQAIGDDQEAGRALTMRGLAEFALDDLTAASESYRNARSIALRLGDVQTEAGSLSGLGSIQFALGHYRRARQLYQRAAELHGDNGDAEHEAQARAALIEVHAFLGDYRGFRENVRRLVHLVQVGGASLDVATRGTLRAGGVWLESGNVGYAADAFAVGILLAAAESTDEDDEEPMVMSIMAPFVQATRLNRTDTSRLERAILRRLERSAPGLSGSVEPVFVTARESARLLAVTDTTGLLSG
jgi:tetratricopeptide (TPR) repeat protein